MRSILSLASAIDSGKDRDSSALTHFLRVFLGYQSLWLYQEEAVNVALAFYDDPGDPDQTHWVQQSNL